MIDLSKAILLIKENAFTWIKVRDAKGALFLSRPKGNEAFTNDDMVKFVENLAKDYPDVWQLELKRNPTTNDKDKHTWKVDLRNPGTPTETTQTITESQIEKRVNEVLEAREKTYMVEDLKEELDEMKTLSGKANYMLMEFFKGFVNKSAPSVQLKGEKDNGNLGAAVTVDGKTELDEANELFLKHVDSSFLLRLAQKVDENPNLVKQVKELLNI